MEYQTNLNQLETDSRMTLRGLICRVFGHRDRRLRQAEEAPVFAYDIPHNRSEFRICSRCGRTRLAKARARKAP